MAVTKSQAAAYYRTAIAIGEVIRDLGRVPSGHLYAQLMGKMDLETYTSFISTLKRIGLVSERFHELHWIGPAKPVDPAAAAIAD